MSTPRKKKTGLPDFSSKVLSVFIAGEDDGRCLERPKWATQGGRLFLVGAVPRGGSANDWCEGIPSAVAWDQITDYLVFDSVEQYLERLKVYERKKRKR